MRVTWEKKLKLIIKKLQLRLAYHKYVVLEERYSATCGAHLLEHIAPVVARQREKMNNLLSECKELGHPTQGSKEITEVK